MRCDKYIVPLKLDFQLSDVFFRCHQNDIENVFSFVLVGSFYLVTDPDPWFATLLFRTFVLSRCLHTVCYLAPLPQPSRFVTCLTGWGVTALMTVAVIRAGSF